MGNGDETTNHGKQLRIIGWAVAGAIAVALTLWFLGTAVPSFVQDAHADEHTEDTKQLDRVIEIAASNALYINTQILAQLYLRADRLKKAKDSGDDPLASEALARAEVEIRRREAQLAL